MLLLMVLFLFYKQEIVVYNNNIQCKDNRQFNRKFICCLAN